MDWDIAQLGLGESADLELVIIVMVFGLALACIGPILAMGGRGGPSEESGHPLRSKLYTAEPIPATSRPLTPGTMKFKTKAKIR